ncbi:MAG: ribose-5-phosphate isomerase [Candidatus Marinimicrobia bacterium]|nr:ribose-5-phosphate isomerase [Candidatus Neomarinimicrobiota bacterium]|tara:strand:+ start:9241 stop:9678 length:438 start_codon:yes stop_codon:yes gene_type:complete
MKIQLATDHAGLDLKNAIGDHLTRKGHKIVDHGAHDYNPQDDYPDFIFPCAEAVAADPDSRGIILGGSGQGEAMCANRVKGVRAAVYYGSESEIPRLSREHNNANILSLGARFISKEEIYLVIDDWLAEPFAGGRHQRRIDKLDS